MTQGGRSLHAEEDAFLDDVQRVDRVVVSSTIDQVVVAASVVLDGDVEARVPELGDVQDLQRLRVTT